MELPTIRSLFHTLMDKHLHVDDAAAVIQQWSDKVQGNPIRRWQDLPAAHQEMYRFLFYATACAAVGADNAEDIAYHMDITIQDATETALLGKER